MQKVHVEATGYVFPWQHQQHRSPVTVSQHRDLGLFQLFFFLVFSYFPTEPYICWHSVLFGANVCQRWTECFKLPALHCWWFLLFFFFFFSLHCRPVFSFFGVCSAFIRCFLMLYPHCIWSCVHFLCTRIKSVSPLIFLQHTTFLGVFCLFLFFFFFLSERRWGGKEAYSLAYSLEETT